MKLTRTTWTFLLICALASLVCWYKLSYPSLAFTNFSIDRTKALQAAQEHLRSRGVDPSEFLTATVFISEKYANQYLQKTLGFEKMKEFVKRQDFDIFFWIVRFFNEQKKEEYRLTVSSSTGQVTSLNHIIDEEAPRREISKEEAHAKAIEFLTERFGFVPSSYELYNDITRTFDNRKEYFISWQKIGSSIPWRQGDGISTGKLTTSARVSGDEILSFSKNAFVVPDQFRRYIAQKTDTGINLSYIIKVLYAALFSCSIFLIITRRNHLAMHSTKNFYIGIMLLSFFLSLVAQLNHFQDILFNYKTTSTFNSYFWQLGIEAINQALFTTVAILMPGLAGELARYQVLRAHPHGSFLHYIQTTFFSRHMTEMVCLGYFIFIVMLGIQSILIKAGQKYLGVWMEHTWIENLSASWFPFLSTFTYGYKTSIFEEIMYRMFAISLFKIFFDKLIPHARHKNTIIAVVAATVIWGFAHSGYPIYPMWFRGLEMTCLGLFLSFIYLRFGIVPVIVGHYLFNVFWHSAEHLLGVTQPFYLYSSLGVLMLPLAFGLTAFVLNRKEEPKPLRWQLNKHQRFNIDVLRSFLQANTGSFSKQTKDQISREITSHGWDPAVVETALEGFLKNEPSPQQERDAN